MHLELSTPQAAVKLGFVAVKPADRVGLAAVICEEPIDPTDIVVECNICLMTSAYSCSSFEQRQWRPTTTINSSIEPLTKPQPIQDSSSRQHTLRSTSSTTHIMSNWQSWPGSRGSWKGRPRGFYGPVDEDFIGRRGAMENNWNPHSHVDMASPADYARDYYGGSWSGRAGLGRHAAMQQQFMGLQPGYGGNSSRLPRGFF